MSADGEAAPTRDLLDDAPCGFLLIDELGQVISANRTLSEWIGVAPDDITGRSVTAIFGLASSVVFETSLLPLLRLQQDVSGVSLDLAANDGTSTPVMISANTHGDGASRITRLVLVKAAARREYERELIDARASAETRLSAEQDHGELREQFVAVLGHDLRNPVASMSSAIRMLSRDLDEAKKAELLLLMQGSVQRMSRLIDNVLDFARNRLGGGIELDIGNGDLKSAIVQAVDELKSVDPNREIELDLSITEQVDCDTWRIGQLVSNLLGNALVHGDPAHPVTLDVSTQAPGHLEISVCNKGEPIPDESMAKLFDPFERNGAAGKQGLGLGLYIASEIAKAHGGAIDVTCDEVICFTFRMPAAA
ncbi:PAS domain-containing sensor histidine kinase [Pseudooceanicola onchidii]|uniref:PAS domain-containing sensor histidine kinase n=1 Tax=Pseudooceanicola onchidii TaxID=2562279 RepID=UPI0010AB0FD9|nr:PAS domain-containing sensor histidine kinase [Pseudooceanicola onchidii]